MTYVFMLKLSAIHLGNGYKVVVVVARVAAYMYMKFFPAHLRFSGGTGTKSSF